MASGGPQPIALMPLTEAVAAVALDPTTPDQPGDHARTLFNRLTLLVTRLANRAGLAPAPRRPAAPPDFPPEPPAAPPLGHPRGVTFCLPRRPGWLLAVLPDTAPALAADIQAVLADPALAALLAAAPTLGRELRPVLRALGLAAPPAPDPPIPDPPLAAPPAPSHTPRPGTPPPPDPLALKPRARTAPSHARFIP